MPNNNSKKSSFEELASTADFNKTSFNEEKEKAVQFQEEIMVHNILQKEKSEMSTLQLIYLIIGLSVVVILFMILFLFVQHYFLSKEKNYQPKLENANQQIYLQNKLNLTKLLDEQNSYHAQNSKLEQKITYLEKQAKSQKQKITYLEKQVKSQKQEIKLLKAAITALQIEKSKVVDQWNSSKTSEKEQNISQIKTINETQQIKFKVRQKIREKIPPKPQRGDRYEFTISIKTVVLQSSLNTIYKNERAVWSGIKKSQFQRSIRLMEVVHNVNFKGEFVFDHHDFYPSPQAKAETLFKLLQEEKQYFDEKYQISKYAHDQIGICVYIPSFNNAKKRLYLRNLDSVFQQEYQNYHIVYVNDASTDGTGDYVKAYMEENEIPAEKYVIINNEKNKGNSENVFNAGHNYCELGEIMVFLDGDDALIGRQVFSLLNAVYQKEKVALIYSQFLFVAQNYVRNGFSRYIPSKSLSDGTFRSLKGFYTSHLKSMYVDVFRQIRQSDFKFQNGTFYNSASDVAYMTPAIELVGTRMKFLEQILYEYRHDTGNNDQSQQQRYVEGLVYQYPPSTKMQNMSFADSPKTVHYQSL